MNEKFKSFYTKHIEPRLQVDGSLWHLNIFLFNCAFAYIGWRFFFKPVIMWTFFVLGVIYLMVAKSKSYTEAFWDMVVKDSEWYMLRNPDGSFRKPTPEDNYDIEFWHLMPADSLALNVQIYIFFDFFVFIMTIIVLIITAAKQEEWAVKLNRFITLKEKVGKDVTWLKEKIQVILLDKNAGLYIFQGAIATLLVWYFFISIFYYTGEHFGVPQVTTANKFYYSDSYSSGIKFFMSFFIITSFNILEGIRKIEAINKHYNEYLIIYTLSLFLLFTLVGVRDLFGIFMCLEGLSLSVIGLMAMNYQSDESLRGAGAYYVLAGVCTFYFFAALTAIYGACHTLLLAPLSYGISNGSREVLAHSSALWLGVMFLALAFLYKLGAYPLHLWVVEVYQGVEWNLLWYLTTIYKVVLFMTTIKIFQGVFYQIWVWKILFLLSVVGSTIYGFAGAYNSVEIKKILAYLSIANTGFILLGFFGYDSTGSLVAAVDYLLYYCLAQTLLLSVIANVVPEGEDDKKEQGILYLSQLTDIGALYPVYAKYIFAALFALSGIPPFPSFWFKVALLNNVFSSNLYGLPLVILLSQVVGAFIFLQWIKNIAIGIKLYKPSDEAKKRIDEGKFKWPDLRAWENFFELPFLYVNHLEKKYTIDELIHLSILNTLLFLVCSVTYLPAVWCVLDVHSMIVNMVVSCAMP